MQGKKKEDGVGGYYKARGWREQDEGEEWREERMKKTVMKMKQSRREKQEISEVEEDGLGHTGFGNTLTSSSRHSSGLRFTAYRAS